MVRDHPFLLAAVFLNIFYRIVNEDAVIEKYERLSAKMRVEKIQDNKEEKTAILPSCNDSFISQSKTTEGQQREILVINEHHPLLDSKNLQSVVKSAEEFNATSQGFDMSNDGSTEFEDGENQEEARGDRRDKRKSIMAQIEDDEKNLMDLGNWRGTSGWRI
ncbi:hypothetical protein GIB67_021056 [Kingdonia uniflora]|uniref:Uncharacterized protein n=1 Tax=Kingdonia uniflora TaxID=39325 RepID=A0A7J7N6Z1_9MAGN|nr:hypothetical protein GIB67_021056 [Kingdonia uniflora]